VLAGMLEREILFRLLQGPQGAKLRLLARADSRLFQIRRGLPGSGHITISRSGSGNIETIISTTAAKLILPLNNEQTAKRFAGMVGKTTVRRRSTSHHSGYTKEAVNLSSNVSDSDEGVDLITTDLLMAMQPGTQIILVQNFMNRPVSLEGIRYRGTAGHKVNPRYFTPVISARTHSGLPVPGW
jgi:hypothetical protein